MEEIISQAKAIIAGSKGFFALILAFCVSLGLVSAPSASEPIKFEDSESVKLSFVTLSDTHARDDSFQGYYLSNFFEDLENTNEKFNAVVVAGDLTDNGMKCEYDAFFSLFDKQTAVDKVLVAIGNHDARFAYKKNKEIIMNKVDEYLGIDTCGKSYYSYDINGYTFIVMGTEAQIVERAYISDAQLSWLDSELERATANGRPAFVVCHQPLKNTHGLPGVWPTGDVGEQSDDILNILTKYSNVFYLNGHLHDGVYERSVQKLADNVYSINIPSYGKGNDFGKYRDSGLGYFVEVYENRVVFTARNFKAGTPTDVKHVFDISV